MISKVDGAFRGKHWAGLRLLLEGLLRVPRKERFQNLVRNGLAYLAQATQYNWNWLVAASVSHRCNCHYLAGGVKLGRGRG